jgi:hypothetical protein
MLFSTSSVNPSKKFEVKGETYIFTFVSAPLYFMVILLGFCVCVCVCVCVWFLAVS